MGIWLSTDRGDLPVSLRRVTVARDAIHLPSVDKDGAPIAASLAEAFLAEARATGLVHLHQARGYWTLSGTGELQAESVRIAFNPAPVDRAALAKLAASVLERGNQDAVAYEIDGTVRVVRRGHA